MLEPEKVPKSEGTTTEICETRSECRLRARTEKGLEMDLQIAKTKKNKAGKDLKKRIQDSYEILRAPSDLVKITACIEGLDIEMNRFRAISDQVLDLLIQTGDDGDIKDDGQFTTLWESSLECMADLKTKKKDLEFERSEMLSQRSSKKSNRSSRTSRSNAISNAKQAIIEATTLKEKMRSLQRRQEIDRRKDELKRQQRELQRLEEEEELRGELNAAEAIKGLLSKDTEDEIPVAKKGKEGELRGELKELNDTEAIKGSHTKDTANEVSETKKEEMFIPIAIQDPWDISQLTQYTPVRRDVSGAVNPVAKDVTPSTKIAEYEHTGNPTDETKSKLQLPLHVGNSIQQEVNQGNLENKSTGTREILIPIGNPDTIGLVDPATSQFRVSSTPAKPYTSPPMDISWQLQSIQRESTEIQRQQVHLLKRLMLPAPKPPIFQGDILEYPKWESAFDALIEEDGDPSRKLYYLGQYTGGVAQRTINGLLGLRTEDAYARARNMLKERYGNPYRIYEEYRKKLFNWPTCKTGMELQELSDFLVMTQETMKTVGYLKELNSLLFIRQLATRLPAYYCNRWRESAKRIEAKKSEYTFNDLVEFVQDAASDATHPVFSLESLSATRRELDTGKEKGGYLGGRSTQRNETKRPQGSTFATSVSIQEVTRERSSNTYVRTCPLCDKSHELDQCKLFLEKSPNERVEVCKSKGICFSCLMKGHMARRCRRKAECSVCKKSHATLLHFDAKVDESEPPPEKAKANSNCISVCHRNDCNNTRTSMIVPVWVHHKDNQDLKVEMYAVLDDQSDTCFITDDACSQLSLSGPEITLELGTMHSVENILTKKIEGLVVSHQNEEVSIPLPRAYSRDQIPARREQIPRPEITRGWEHLKPISEQIAPYRRELKIGLLVGNNCVRAIKPRQVLPGKATDPYAMRTALGWGVIGAEVQGSECDGSGTRCHYVSTRGIDTDSGTSFLITQPAPHKEVMTPLAVKRLFEQEFPEKHCSDKPLSQEDFTFMKMMTEHIHRTDDGHYEMPLPLREDGTNLPCNRRLAEVRLKQLKTRFDRDPKYKQDYVAFVEDMLAKGYAEEAPRHYARVWYVPHHGVYHAKKPDKIRVVFDCSAQYEGHSLNQHLLQGPDLTNTLTGVLCRFRQEPVCFACDIEGMFCQVRVNEEQRDLLRFLFWEKGDTSSTPKEYRMRVHLFGATSSPGCANLALKKTADDNADCHENAAKFLKTNFYVDDGLVSTGTVTEAVSLIKEAREMCAKGGFRLHKFVSNSKEVLESVPVIDRAKGVKELNLDQDALPIERVLGVEWCVENDSFQFRIHLKDKPLTRRGILSTVSSIYDPLGFAAPFMLRGKKILQLLCKEGVGWDDDIPDSLRHEWQMWRKELPLLEKMKIPRCHKPNGFETPKTVELHHFSDASVDGYGQCSYLRLVNEKDEVHCSLVMGKARVSPLKPITIPRMELAAAVTSVRVSQMLRRELTLPVDEEVFWTDSQVVKAYINNEARRFHTYVANRVQQIRDHTSPTQWKYVESQNNPADDASRGLSPKSLLQTSRWLQGPSFLWEPAESWKDFTSDTYEISTDDKEVKKSSAFSTVAKESSTPLVERLGYFSDWYRAKRAVANCLKYLRTLRDRVQKKFTPASTTKQPIGTSTPTVAELQESERIILREVQKNAYISEMKELANGRADPGHDSRVHQRELKRKSDLLRLDPFIDKHGILRVGGRIKNASIDFGLKHPVIVPKDSHISHLIAKDCHESTKHQGRGLTLNEVRSSGYWLVSGGSVVSKLIHDCVTCRKMRAAGQEQKMADLPNDRLEPTPPFTYCAVDYFGPWTVKEGRKELKRYGVLFTCLFSRAIHLEVANSLDTSSFINALRRFICRRGPVRQLRSDRGTNFVGARRELLEALKEMDGEAVKGELAKSNCDWIETKFNVPSASHMGGVWERQIRTVRSVLSALLFSCGSQLNDEALRTFMCEAEAVVNGRPLTADGRTAPMEALTPNHFLTMKSKVILPPPGNFQAADLYSRKWWRRVQHLTNEFWIRWRKEFLLSLQERQKWTRQRRNMEPDDIVLIKDDDSPRNQWRLSKVTDVIRDEDGLVRKVRLLVGSPNLSQRGERKGQLSTLERPIQKLVLLIPKQER